MSTPKTTTTPAPPTAPPDKQHHQPTNMLRIVELKIPSLQGISIVCDSWDEAAKILKEIMKSQAKEGKDQMARAVVVSKWMSREEWERLPDWDGGVEPAAGKGKGGQS